MVGGWKMPGIGWRSRASPARGAPSAGGFSLENTGRVSPEFAAREPNLDSLRRGPVPRFLGSVPRFLGGFSFALALLLLCFSIVLLAVPRLGSWVPWPVPRFFARFLGPVPRFLGGLSFAVALL